MPFSFHEQVEQLKRHNMIIEDEAEVESFLTSVNYYRFTGYALQYRIAPDNSDYVPGTKFEDVRRLYLFDIELRNVLRKYIEVVELYYRTQISYHFALSKCMTPPHDQHYNTANYYLPDDVEEILDSFEDRGPQYYKDSLIMQHHQEKYDNRFPLWVMVEMLSFSDLSKLYGGMYESDQSIIAAASNTGHTVLKNNLHCLAFLRNKCAHGARLYNARFAPPAKLPNRFLTSFPDTSADSLFAFILVLIKRLPSDTDKINCISEVCSLVKKHLTARDLSCIGFPQTFQAALTQFRYP